MKKLKLIIGTILIATSIAIPLAARATDSTNTPAKPYPLDTCLVCDMKLAMMSKPITFVYQGQEIKVCDKSEKADFEKNPSKYIKKLADAELQMKMKK